MRVLAGKGSSLKARCTVATSGMGFGWALKGHFLPCRWHFNASSTCQNGLDFSLGRFNEAQATAGFKKNCSGCLCDAARAVSRTPLSKRMYRCLLTSYEYWNPTPLITIDGGNRNRVRSGIGRFGSVAVMHLALCLLFTFYLAQLNSQNHNFNHEINV